MDRTDINQESYDRKPSSIQVVRKVGKHKVYLAVRFMVTTRYNKSTIQWLKNKHQRGHHRVGIPLVLLFTVSN